MPKVKNKGELVDGIKNFWSTDDVHVAKCAKYVHHLQKVIPKVINLCHEATDY